MNVYNTLKPTNLKLFIIIQKRLLQTGFKTEFVTITPKIKNYSISLIDGGEHIKHAVINKLNFHNAKEIVMQCFYFQRL